MTTFLRTLFFFTVFWLHQAFLIPFLGIYILQARRDPAAVRKRIFPIIHRWGRIVTRLGGARLDVQDHSNLPPDEPVLIVSNHQDEFDIPILTGHVGRPIAFVAKQELARLPLLSRWMRLMGCVFLDRDDRRKQVLQIRETIERLQGGLSMVIFPEGSRSGCEEMQPFARGSLNIALKAGVRILPATLSGSWRLKPLDRLRLPGAHVRLTFHPPIDPAKLPKDDQDRLHEILRDIIATGLDSSS